MLKIFAIIAFVMTAAASSIADASGSSDRTELAQKYIEKYGANR